MSPVVDRPEWESALSSRRLLPNGDDSKANVEEDEVSPMKSMAEDSELQLLTTHPEVTSLREDSTPVTPSNSVLATVLSPEPLPNRSRSTSPGRSLIPPAIPSEANKNQGENYAVGAPVLYWSGTHGQWMDAVVTRVNYDTRGQFLNYDLDVKRGAQASKIRKPGQALAGFGNPQAGEQSLMPASIQKVPTPVSNTAAGDQPQIPQVVTVGVSAVVNAADKSPTSALAENAPLATSLVVPSVPPSTLALPPSAAIPKLIASVSGSGTPGGPGAVASLKQEPPSEALTKEASLIMRKFDIGERVEYWSGTYSQWMQARVERVRTDGITYDLDVKRGAQRRKMRSLRRNDSANVPTPGIVSSAPLTIGNNGAITTSAPPPLAMPVKASAKAKTSSPIRGIGRGPASGGSGTAVGSATSVPAAEPNSTGRELVPSSRLRGVSREPPPSEPEEISPMPKQPTFSGGYPRSGSPFVEKHHPSSVLEKASAPAPGSQTDSAAIDPGRLRMPSGGLVSVGKSRQDLGRPGPVASASVGLTSGSTGPSTGFPQIVTNGLLGAKVGGQPRRFLPDSSGGPTIGTRPDGLFTSSTSPSTASALADSRSPINRATPAGHVTINGIVKKVGPNGVVSSGAASEKVMVQQGEKTVVRPLPASSVTALPPGSSAQRQILGSTTGNENAVSQLASMTGKSPAIDQLKPPASDERLRRDIVPISGTGNATSSANSAREGLETASHAELLMIAQQLGVEIDPSEPAGPKVQVALALNRLPVKDVLRRLAEAHVDIGTTKDKKELDSLFVHALISRHRSSSQPSPGRQRISIATTVPPPPELSPPATVARRTPGSASSGATAAGSTPTPSALVATGITASVLEKPELEVGELDIGSGPFDPTSPSVCSQLTSALGYSENSVIEEMTGFRGGLNEGVWFLSDSSRDPPARDLVLKLVKCTRISSTILTEAENFVKVFSEFPRMSQDSSVAFPVRIFKCLGPAPERLHRHDLIVMWKARGERMAELIAHKWYQKQFDVLWEIFDQLGQALSAYHMRYNENQHGDFQPSNVMYDEDTGEIALIDIGGMGVPTATTDIEHFSKSLKLLADVYGSQLLSEGFKSFEAGYARGIRAR